jgi:polysaccharide export outer membrane protein
MSTVRSLNLLVALSVVGWSGTMAAQAPSSTASKDLPAAVRPAQPATSATAVGIKPPDDYVIGADDVLTVMFWPDGKITLPLINEIQAAGLTPDQLRERVVTEAGRFIEDPSPSVIVKTINSRKVFITGEVEKPGPYLLTAPTTVLQLIATAGGLREYAHQKDVVIMRMDGGRQVTFPFDYAAVAKRKKLNQNIFLKPGDTVVVP